MIIRAIHSWVRCFWEHTAYAWIVHCKFIVGACRSRRHDLSMYFFIDILKQTDASSLSRFSQSLSLPPPPLRPSPLVLFILFWLRIADWVRKSVQPQKIQTPLSRDAASLYVQCEVCAYYKSIVITYVVWLVTLATVVTAVVVWEKK